MLHFYSKKSIYENKTFGSPLTFCVFHRIKKMLQCAFHVIYKGMNAVLCVGVATQARIHANNQVTPLVKHYSSLLYTVFFQKCQKTCVGVVYNQMLCFPFSSPARYSQHLIQSLLVQKSLFSFTICWALNFTRAKPRAETPIAMRALHRPVSPHKILPDPKLSLHTIMNI